MGLKSNLKVGYSCDACTTSAPMAMSSSASHYYSSQGPQLGMTDACFSPPVAWTALSGTTKASL